MSNISPRKRKLCDFSEETVTILIGPTTKSFTVHPTMLANHSRYFRAMFSTHSFRESFEKHARLPEVDAGVFQVYVAYVYSDNVVLLKSGGEEEYSDANDPEGIARFQSLVQLYAFANYAQDASLKNKVIDYLMGPSGILARGATAMTIKLAFDTSPEKSALCQLLIDTYLSSCNPTFLEESWKDLPLAFLGSLSLGWAKATWDKDTVYDHPSTAARCKYHEHDEEVPVDESGTCGIVPFKTTPKKGAKGAGLRR